MLDDKVSCTAIGTAYLRAAHQVFETHPRIFDDPVALSLIGPNALQRIKGTEAHYQTPAMRALRARVVLRSRFAEDRLAAAVLRGVTQYVILGAGCDTFALRQPPWARPLRIFEVDHPRTQEGKRSRLSAAGLTIPENVALVGIDFEHEPLHVGLKSHHIMNQPTFFSWLGVTMYLKEDTIDAVLRSVTAFPVGSEIVLTIALQKDESLSIIAQRAASIGEPWVSYFKPDAFAAKLIGAGFSKVEFLSSAEAQARYFSQGQGGLPAPKSAHILCAVV
jgi:methyltransferase (TIGR00027 family)